MQAQQLIRFYTGRCTDCIAHRDMRIPICIFPGCTGCVENIRHHRIQFCHCIDTGCRHRFTGQNVTEILMETEPRIIQNNILRCFGLGGIGECQLIVDWIICVECAFDGQADDGFLQLQIIAQRIRQFRRLDLFAEQLNRHVRLGHAGLFCLGILHNHDDFTFNAAF